MHPLSHQSAALVWDLPLLAPPTDGHITVPADHHHQHPGCVVHRADLRPGDVWRVDGEPVTSPGRTVQDVSRTLDFREALAIADAALRRNLVQRSELVRRGAAARGPGAGRVRAVAHHADRRAASLPESFLRAIVLTLDLGRIQPQMRFEEDGHAYDLGLIDLQMLTEQDSSHHAEALRVSRDTEDVTEAAVRGWPLLRFSYAATVHRPSVVEAALLSVAARQRLLLPVTRAIVVAPDPGYRYPQR